MTDASSESSLPRVDNTDIASVLLDDILDPSHRGRYEHFANENPDLIREISRRAYIEAYEKIHQDNPLSLIDLQKMVIDSVTFALSALEIASIRHRDKEEQDDTIDKPHTTN